MTGPVQPEALSDRVTLYAGDCLDAMRGMIAAGVKVHSIVSDPPYHLQSIVQRFGAADAAPAQPGTDGAFGRISRGFMGQKWDGGDIAFRSSTWQLAAMVLPPGGYIAAFGSTRTFHRMACAMEDAGLEIRDTVMWIYGTGWPKSHNHEGGIGTALKPAWEPIVIARRPLRGSVAGGLARDRVGGLNIDACRIHGADALGGEYTVKRRKPGATMNAEGGNYRSEGEGEEFHGTLKPGRWPANIVHDGSEEVEAAFAAFGQRGAKSPIIGSEPSALAKYDYGYRERVPGVFHDDAGSASRFFYCAKASTAERVHGCTMCGWRALGAHPKACPTCAAEKWESHPTVKPQALMRWLVRLITPPGGTVLDPFSGTGTTGAAAVAEGLRAVLCEAEPSYQADIRIRMGVAA